MASLSAGVVTTRAAATALDFLNQKYPGLKGSVR
jgi:hypothetical protein